MFVVSLALWLTNFNYWLSTFDLRSWPAIPVLPRWRSTAYQKSKFHHVLRERWETDGWMPPNILSPFFVVNNTPIWWPHVINSRISGPSYLLHQIPKYGPCILCIIKPQSYTRKGHTLIQVLPPLNILLSTHACIHFYYTDVCIQVHFNKNAYMHEQKTIGYLGEEVPEWVYALFWC